jgi:hypothetical protein
MSKCDEELDMQFEPPSRQEKQNEFFLATWRFNLFLFGSTFRRMARVGRISLPIDGMNC